MPQQLLMVYTYGWGKLFRLYNDHLEIDGTSYALDDLKTVRPTYYHFMGVPSARLVLHFQQQKVVLRGIAAVDELRQVVVFLSTPYSSRSSATRIVPMCREREENGPVTERTVRVRSPMKREGLDTHQAPTIPVETPRLSRFSQGRAGHPVLTFEEEELARRLKEEPLPVLPVPLYLLPGEYAHYIVAAILCEEPTRDAMLHSYQARDQGMLILTNRRLIYMGRNGQIVLDYSRLLHVSRLQGAIAVLAEHWPKSELFELQQPLECSMYLEYLKVHCVPEQAFL
jgi:hypothetical protein